MKWSCPDCGAGMNAKHAIAGDYLGLDYLECSSCGFTETAPSERSIKVELALARRIEEVKRRKALERRMRRRLKAQERAALLASIGDGLGGESAVTLGELALLSGSHAERAAQAVAELVRRSNKPSARHELQRIGFRTSGDDAEPSA